MPKATSTVVQLRLNDLLLKFYINGKIDTEELDSLCGISFNPSPSTDTEIKKARARNEKARARYIQKMRDFHNADIEYDRANKCYVLKNTDSFPFILNLNIQVTPGMLAAFSAGNVFIQKFLPHLAGSSSKLQTELEQLFGKPLFSEGQSLASSVTMSLPTARIDGTVFSLVQQAIREKRTISFSYTSPNPEAAQKAKQHRSYSPWRLYFTDRSWYVWGSFKNSPNGIPYKICRMKDLTLGGENEYSPPSKSQEPDKILRSVWSARPGTPQHDVVLSFLPPLAASIEETEWPDSVSITKGKKDGEILLSTKVPDLQGVAFFVLAGAPFAFANEPEELRSLVIALSEKQQKTQKEIHNEKSPESASEGPDRKMPSADDLNEMYALYLSDDQDDPFPATEKERE